MTLPPERADLQTARDATFLEIARRLAEEAALHGYKSFGAVIVDLDGNQVGLGIGDRRTTNDHAETEAIRMATRRRINLRGFTIYVTHEPCDLCLAAVRRVGLERVCWPIT